MTPQMLTQPLDQNQQAILALSNLYGNWAEAGIDNPFGNIAYNANKRSSIPIPSGAILQGLTAHFHVDVTLNLASLAAPALSPLAVLAAVNEIYFNYNGAKSPIWVSDSIFALQRLQMEYPDSGYQTAWIMPVPTGTGTAYSYDWYAKIPAVYSDLTLMGVLNENSDNIHSEVGIKWGDVANIFKLLTGQTATATGYVEFIADRLDAPSDPKTDGAPDLTKNYVVTYQDIPLTQTKNNMIKLQATDTITRATFNFFEGGVGQGGVEAYDYANALQVLNLKWAWGKNSVKYNAPYWWWQQEAAKNYGAAFKQWINAGTIVVDQDRTNGRDWLDGESVVNLRAIVDLGAAPPAGSFVRVCLEQLVNTGTVPLR